VALNVLASGGIFLGGGIPPRILARLQQPDFIESTTQKGRFKRLLEAMPLHVILDPQVTLHGAAFEALALQKE
jgi:glucokinase